MRLSLTAAAIALAGLAPAATLAQIAVSPLERLAADDPDARMLLEATELVYDFDNEVVSAVGNVQIYYRGYTVESDRVTYEQSTGRVFARGNVRLTEPDGNVLYADTVELTDDFREGFVEQLTLVTPERARFAAISAERIEDNVTIFNRGVYTACEPCEADPGRPPVWQIKAARIIHNQQERVVYYENASFEFLGMPIAYVPFFSHPDPTVRRQSGFLTPNLIFESSLGAGAKIPYFFALAPNYDLTVAATGFTKQGVLGEFEWRHRLASGVYTVQGAGIQQQRPEEFDPDSPGNREWRGFLRSAGEFRINDFWRWGFDGRVVSDPTFMRRYRFTGETEYRNQVFLSGQSARNWFDARIIDYRTMTSLDTDRDASIPFVHPVIDHNYIMDQPVLGGRLRFDTNALSLTRDEADFVNAISNAGPGARCPANPASVSDPDDLLRRCHLIGAPGNFNRLVTKAQWDRTIVDSLGQMFTPFASMRGDAYTFDVNDPYVGGPDGAVVGHYFDTGQQTILRGMPAAGLEYRFPFLISSGWGHQIIEPTAQIIARPDEPYGLDIPNEDAQSLVFDDTTLFSRDKFSGYDRIEGGTRANVGVRYNLQANNGMAGSAVFGQSYHLAGENPFPVGSGLESNRSDYVAAAYFQPMHNVEVASRLRLDERDFSLRRHDLQIRGSAGPVKGTLIYSDISADPLAGIDFDRQEIQAASTVRLDENWRVFGSGRLELEGPQTGSQWISHSFGLGYVDECIALAVAYERTYVRDGDIEPDERITFRFNIRTVTEGQLSSSIASSRGID